MRNLILLVVLGAGGYFGWKQFGKPSPAVVAYQAFADLFARHRLDEARQLAMGPALTSMDQLEAEQTRPVGPNIRGLQTSQRALTSQIAGPVVSTHQEVKKSTKRDANTVSLEATSSVCREAPGCTGMRCTRCVDFAHVVDVCRDGEAWKVCAFAETFIEPPP